MSRDGVTCDKNVTDMLLFATPDGLARIAVNSLQRFHDVLIAVPGIRKAVAVDFHWERQLVVYADITKHHIKYAHSQTLVPSLSLTPYPVLSLLLVNSVVSMHDWGHPKTIITNVSEPASVAVDWLANNLYWADAARSSIEVARLDGSLRKLVVTTLAGTPRAVVLHPKKG